MKPIKTRYWLNLALLVCGLILTLFSISLLKGDKSLRFLNSLGFGHDGQMLNWCTNRVKTLTMGQSSIQEKDGKWVWAQQDVIELNYLAVEKWFARNCQLKVEKIEFKDFNSELIPMLEVEFITGEEAVTFYDLGQGRYQIQNQIFKSPHLRKALKELLDFAPDVQ